MEAKSYIVKIISPEPSELCNSNRHVVLQRSAFFLIFEGKGSEMLLRDVYVLHALRKRTSHTVHAF